jgi:hypothetical protein
MKKWKYALLVASFLVSVGLCVVLALQRMDALNRIVPTIEMIKEKDYLAAFHVGVVKFIPIELDLDTSRLEYDYETNSASAAELFAISDGEAVRNGWMVEERSVNGRTYSKFLRFNQYYQVEQIVQLTFFPEHRQVKVVNSRGRWAPPIGARP